MSDRARYLIIVGGLALGIPIVFAAAGGTEAAGLIVGLVLVVIGVGIGLGSRR